MAGEPHLTDTNILLRLTRRDDPDYAVVRGAAQALRQSGSVLCYTPQNLVEFWNVVTRPKDRNGFGLSVVEADHEAKLIEGELTLLPDNDQIHRRWRELVVAHRVSGVQVHDARLAAAMQAHGITHLLTLNVQDFVRYSGIKVVHPRELTRT
jgi:predicted nucleic acid-binding protein